MKKKWRPLVGMAVLITLMIGTLGSGHTIQGETGTIEISRDKVGQMAIDASKMIEGLYEARLDLSKSYTDLSKQTDGMKALYAQLPAYKGLYNLYVAMALVDVNYHLYLQKASNPATLAEALAMVDEPAKPEELQLATAIADPNNMTVAQYVTYTVLKQQFDLMGITNPNLSREEEYERFVEMIYVTPMQLQSSMMSMKYNIEMAEAGLAKGAVSIFDAILNLEGYENLQVASYDLARKDYLKADRLYHMGRLSEVDYKMAVNKEKIARMSRDTMSRQVANLKMNLNVMLAQDVTAKLALEGPSMVVTPNVLEPLDYYIERGFNERGELMILKWDEIYKNHEFSYIKDYYSVSTDKYKLAALELEDLGYKKDQLKTQIEYEIRLAYLNVKEKEEAYRIKNLSYQDAKRQYDQMSLNVALGFVTENLLASMDMLVTQTKQDLEAANRDYISAIAALNGASTLGPAYQ